MWSLKLQLQKWKKDPFFTKIFMATHLLENGIFFRLRSNNVESPQIGGNLLDQTFWLVFQNVLRYFSKLRETSGCQPCWRQTLLCQISQFVQFDAGRFHNQPCHSCPQASRNWQQQWPGRHRSLLLLRWLWLEPFRNFLDNDPGP